MLGFPNPSGPPRQTPPRQAPEDEPMLTDLSFLDVDEPWPPKSQVARLNRYRDNRALWDGRHGFVFNDWQRLLRDDQLAVLEFVFNLPKRLSTLWSDLLLGEPPAFEAAQPEGKNPLPGQVTANPGQDALDDLVTRNQLATTAYEVMIDTSRYGDGLFKLRLDKGEAIIEGQPPAFWFPIASRDNIRQIQAHVLAWTFDVVARNFRGEKKTTTYLRVEIHTKGLIENRVYELETNSRGKEIKAQRDLAELQIDRPEFEPTNVDEFLIIPVAGLRTTDRYYGMDDYSDLTTILLELETRVGQISRILDKHSDPSMYGPNEVLEKDPNTGEYIYRGGGKFFQVQEGDDPPGYVVWDGQLAAAFTELEKLIELFYIVSETSPAAFGQMDAGLASSGTALRRLMMAPLAKVNRVRLRLDPAFKRLLTTAIALEGNAPPASIHIHWRDGLPEDPVEMTTVEVARKGAGLSSTYSSLKRLDGGTDEEIQREEDRIAEDEANKTATNPLLPGLRLRMPPQGDGNNGNIGSTPDAASGGQQSGSGDAGTGPAHGAGRAG